MLFITLKFVQIQSGLIKHIWLDSHKGLNNIYYLVSLKIGLEKEDISEFPFK